MPSPRIRSNLLAEALVSKFGNVLTEAAGEPIQSPHEDAAALASQLAQDYSAHEIAARYLRDSKASRRPGWQGWAHEAALLSLGWVILPTGEPVPYEAALASMAHPLRARLGRRLAHGNTMQSFVDQYCLLHEDQYDEPFLPSAAIPRSRSVEEPVGPRSVP